MSCEYKNQMKQRPSLYVVRQRALRKLWIVSAVVAIHLICGCRTSYITLVQDRETLTQLAPFLYILSGNYDGQHTVAQFRAAGNIGIGTFNGLDGEAVLLDGVVYQIKGDGSVSPAADTQCMPFGTCTLFDDDQRLTLKNIASFDAFTSTLTAQFKEPNIFYAIKAHGVFDTIRVRSCDRQEKPYQPLAAATRLQHEYTYAKVSGTLVGFWTPPFVPGAIGVPGFHLHFLSDDHKQGGHVLAFESRKIEISLDPSPRITLDFSTPVTVALVTQEIERQVNDAEKGRGK